MATRSGRSRRRSGGRQNRLRAAAGGTRRAPARAAAAGGRHLRPRQLGACGDVRQAPHRALYRAARGSGRAEHRERLSPGLLLRDQLFLAVSQSGRSDDLVALATSAKASGALTVAIVNATDGPLAAACDIVLPVGAGPELSVAATKTFVATSSALLRLVAAWTGDGALDGAIGRLPDAAGGGIGARLERRASGRSATPTA